VLHSSSSVLPEFRKSGESIGDVQAECHRPMHTARRFGPSNEPLAGEEHLTCWKSGTSSGPHSAAEQVRIGRIHASLE
jgi:hypothetical protein